MSLLSGVVVVVALLGVINLLLLVAVLRRLSEHQGRLDSFRSEGDPDEGLLVAGDVVGPFVATTTTGDRLERDAALRERVQVGFFSPTCAPCEEQLPLFVDLVGEGGRAISVVLDDPGARDERDAMLARLSERGPVVLASHEDQVVRAFRVGAYPAMFTLGPDGLVESSGHSVNQLSGLQTTR